MPKRLPVQQGEWIDRRRNVKFSFEGVSYSAYEGDTISSALLAAGLRLLGRSFKYHRARGVLSMANHDVNVMVTDGVRTNMRADVLPVRDGMDLQAVNAAGGLKHDSSRFINYLSPFLPVGFYYKTFFRPRRFFPFWEKKIRALAGLGSINAKAPRVVTPKRYDFCDVLVIGAGPAGLSAAVAAAEQGVRVVVVDENAHAGGSLQYQWASEPRAAPLLEALMARVSALDNLDVRTATTAMGYYSDHWVALVDDTRMTKMRAGQVIVACGSYEQPAVFRYNDLPGVMLGSGAQRLIRRYAIKPCERAVVLAANSDGYRVALDLLDAGVTVVAVADLRREGEAGHLAEQLRQRSVPVHNGHTVYEAAPDRAGNLASARLCAIGAQGTVRDDLSQSVACDGLIMSVGWAPAGNLLYQAGTRMDYSEAVEQFVPAELPDGIHAAGRVNGVYALDAQFEDGRRAGLAACAGLSLYSGDVPAVPRHNGPSPSHPYPVFAHPKGKNFLDFDEDLQLADLENACQEGFDNIELMKRFSTVGMGPSQGKHSNMNAVRILARIRGQSIMATGTTTARPFFHPMPLKMLAGRSFNPERITSLHQRHVRLGAQFMPVGAWQRPEFYAVSGQSRQQAIDAEVRAVHEQLGLIDVGTLGKIEVRGPDAAAFLERIYSGGFHRQKVGSMGLALRCDEAGVVTDDGIAARFDHDCFYVTASSTRSDAVVRDMQFWQAQWAMDVVIINATAQLGAMNLAGPHAREALRGLTDCDLEHSALPFGGVVRGTVAGVPARIMRVGFVGELGFEVHVPSQQAGQVWDALMQAGKDFGIRPFGVEAQRILRLEKGYAIAGQDTDGLTTPDEMNMGWAVKMKKPFFVGQRSLRIIQQQPLKRLLIGYSLSPDHAGPMPRESHLVIHDGEMVGRVTSVGFSHKLGRVIGLCFLQPELAAAGSAFQIRIDGGAMVTATVESLPFYDPDNLVQGAPADNTGKGGKAGSKQASTRGEVS